MNAATLLNASGHGLKRRLSAALVGAMLAALMLVAPTTAAAADDPGGASASFVPGPPPGEWTGPVYPPGIVSATDADGDFCLARDGVCLGPVSESAGDAAVPPTTVGVSASPTNPGRYQDVTFSWSVYPSQGAVCADHFGNRWSNTAGATFPRGVWDQPSRFDYWVYCNGPGGEAASSVAITIQGEAPPPPPPPPPPPSGDASPPTAPTGLRTTLTTTGRIALAWSPSTDDVGVAGYRAWLNGNHASTTGATAWTYLGLVCGSTYLLQVSAFDAAGNVSGLGSLHASTAACPPSTDYTVLEDDGGDGGYFWAQGTGLAYLLSLTDPGGDRGSRSKTGCGFGEKRKVRRGFTYINVLYRTRLRGTWCWRSVWDGALRRHVPEVYDIQAECTEGDVDSSIVIDSSCDSPSLFFMPWNHGRRGKVEITAIGRYRNCFEGIPFIDGCLPWAWHDTLKLTFYGDGTWSRS